MEKASKEVDSSLTPIMLPIPMPSAPPEPDNWHPDNMHGVDMIWYDEMGLRGNMKGWVKVNASKAK